GRNTAEFLIKYHNQFLIDQEWARRCGAWIEQVYYPELEELGLYFRRDDEGNVVTSPGAIRSVAANVQGNSGVPFMDLRRKQVIRAGIPRLEETVATALVRNDDGNIGGVFCLNIMTGEYVVVRARAVVMATGYSDRQHGNAMVAHQRHRRPADLAAHAGLSQPDAGLGEVGANGQFGGRGIFQPAERRPARLRPLHGPAQGACEAGACRQGTL